MDGWMGGECLGTLVIFLRVGWGGASWGVRLDAFEALLAFVGME